MNGIDNPIFFYPTAIILLVFAVLTISFRNIFYSLLCAIVVFFAVGVIFYVLGSEYNAVIQIAIYGAAVPIILGLAIMFTNPKSEIKVSSEKSAALNYLIILSVGVFALAVVYLVLTSLSISPLAFNLTEQVSNSSIGTLSAFSQGLFGKFIWSFELISVVLTIVVVGLTLFSKKKGGK